MYQGKRILRLLHFSHDAKASELFSFLNGKTEWSEAEVELRRKNWASMRGGRRGKALSLSLCRLGSDLGYENHLTDTCWMFIHESHAFSALDQLDVDFSVEILPHFICEHRWQPLKTRVDPEWARNGCDCKAIFIVAFFSAFSGTPWQRAQNVMVKSVSSIFVVVVFQTFLSFSLDCFSSKVGVCEMILERWEN